MARNELFARLPKFRRGAFSWFLTATLVSAFLADQPIATSLLLVPHRVLAGEQIWTLLSANVIYPEGRMMALVGTLAIQWVLGGELEQFWGTRRYLGFLVGCSLFGYVTAVVVGLLSGSVSQFVYGGTQAGDLAVVAAFGVVYGQRPLALFGGVLPLRSRGLALLIVGITFLGPLANGLGGGGSMWPAVIPWLGSLAAALVITTQPWRRLKDSGTLKRSSRKRAPHLQVVRPDREYLN